MDDTVPCICAATRRDIKPEKLLIGEDGRCKLHDFSSASTRHRIYSTERDIAAAKEEIKSHTTAAYRAPEQVSKCFVYVGYQRL